MYIIEIKQYKLRIFVENYKLGICSDLKSGVIRVYYNYEQFRVNLSTFIS